MIFVSFWAKELRRRMPPLPRTKQQRCRTAQSVHRRAGVISGRAIADEGVLAPSLDISGRLRVGGDGWRRRGGLLWAVGRRRAVEWFNSARRHGGGDFLWWLKHTLQMLKVTKDDTKDVVAFLKASPVRLCHVNVKNICVRKAISNSKGRIGCVLSIAILGEER